MTGQKLRFFREFRNYSQEYIAEKLGITQTSYSRIETNRTKISAERLGQLAAILKVPTTDLLSDNEPVIQCNDSSFHHLVLTQKDEWNELLDNMRQHYEQLISSKDERISFLENEVNNLHDERSRMIWLIEKITINRATG
jgi:transcriptional regulator with XRE-family HTH domain